MTQRSNQKLILLNIALVLAIICSLLFRAYISRQNNSPNVQQLQVKTEAEAAVQRSGANLLPSLIRLVDPPHNFLRDRLSRFHFWGFHVRSVADEQNFALFAFMALGTNTQPAIPQLENILTNSLTGCFTAAYCLSTTGPAAIPILTREMTNANPFVRENASMAIGMVNPPSKESVPALLDRLHDEAPSVQAWAARSLGSIHTQPERVLPSLGSLLQNSNSDIRGAAAQAIRCFGREAIGSTNDLAPLLNDPIPAVRWEAKGALDWINYDSTNHSAPARRESTAHE